MKKVLVFFSRLSRASLCACRKACTCGCAYCCGREKYETETPFELSINSDHEHIPIQQEPSVENEQRSELAIEDFEITSYEKGELGFKVKIRNISEIDIEKFTFLYQLLGTTGISCNTSFAADPLSHRAKLYG